MKQFHLALVVLTFSQTILNAHFYENIQETDVIRVYVQPENIKLTEKGIHLDLEDGQKIILPNIQSNENGLYTSLSNNDSRKYLHYTCPGCGVTYYWWENCSTPGCSKNSQG